MTPVTHIILIVTPPGGIAYYGGFDSYGAALVALEDIEDVTAFIVKGEGR